MAQTFLASDREQELLLPPSLREWLPEGHLAWFVIDALAEIDLSAFYAAYREAGHGRGHEPAMMVALLLYAYAAGRLDAADLGFQPASPRRAGSCTRRMPNAAAPAGRQRPASPN